MPMRDLVKKSVRRLREDGVRNLWRRAHSYVYDAYREQSLGIATEDWIEWEGSHSNSLFVDYEPLAYWHIEKVLSAFTITPGHDVFLDYGSGKGRIVTTAAMRPFRKVTGVEVLEDLSLTAQQNFDCVRPKLKCQTAEFVTADATTYEVPSDVTHIFFFNPFAGAVLESVLTQIYDSWQQSPREIEIAYVLPRSNDNLLEECSWLRCTHKLALPHWLDLDFRIYVTSSRQPS